MGKNFDSRPYCINDFKEWHERRELVLAPYFQRRSVWSDKARSYLIDTILRGLPIPKIYMRHQIDDKTHKSIREIVDGQQRLRTILDFLNNGFKVLKTHNSKYCNLYFSQLPKNIQNEFLRYEISTDLIPGLKDELVLDIFARLNTYTVSLNKQELINSRYFGDFKQTAYYLGREFYNFWITNKILSRHQILRMDEAELSSELIIAMVDGIQSKNVVESYYKKYDDNFPMKKKVTSEFKVVMDTLGGIFEDILSGSIFHRKPHFYSIFCVIYDLMYGLKNSSLKKRINIKPIIYPKIRNAIGKLEIIFNNPNEYPEYKKFIDACSRHTTNEPERKLRHDVIGKIILNEFGG